MRVVKIFMLLLLPPPCPVWTEPGDFIDSDFNVRRGYCY